MDIQRHKVFGINPTIKPKYTHKQIKKRMDTAARRCRLCDPRDAPKKVRYDYRHGRRIQLVICDACWSIYLNKNK